METPSGDGPSPKGPDPSAPVAEVPDAEAVEGASEPEVGEDDKAVIRALFQAQKQERGEEACPICFNSFWDYASIVDRQQCSTCKQQFCKDCIEQYEAATRDHVMRTEGREIKPSCPTCRAEVGVWESAYLDGERLRREVREAVMRSLQASCEEDVVRLRERAGSVDVLGAWIAAVGAEGSPPAQVFEDADESFFLAGDKVVLHGLGAARLNGESGIVMRYLISEDGTERFGVKLLSEGEPANGEAAPVKSIKRTNLRLAGRSPRNVEAKLVVDARVSEIVESWGSVKDFLTNEEHGRSAKERVPMKPQTPEHYVGVMKEGACVDPARVLARKEEAYFLLEPLQARKLSDRAESTVIVGGAPNFVYPLYRENNQVSNVRSITAEREAATYQAIRELTASGRQSEAQELARKLEESKQAIAKVRSKTEGKILIRSPRSRLQDIHQVQGLPPDTACFVVAYTYMGPI